jgi:hypothetical protein
MTAEVAEVAAAAAAVGAGEREARDWVAHAERVQAASPQVETADAARSPADGAVAWPSTSTAGQPPAVSPQPVSSPNLTDPRDNSQSQ